jgi:3',5'-cyclic AMP phosphodiesterase CpdA
MTAVFLHLSDIHIKDSRDPILARAKSIAASVYSSLTEATALFIVVSGDIAFSGKADQYDEAHKLLTSIQLHINEEKELPVHFAICPGNHDCNFELHNQTRQLVLDALVQKGVDSVDESVIAACCKVQEPFHEFEARLNPAISNSKGDKLWRTFVYDVDDSEIVLDCLNVAWMSRKTEEQGTLAFPFTRYLRLETSKPELRVAILHHPLNWISQHTYRPFRSALRKLENVIISGHEHIGNVGENVDSESGRTAYVEGCVLQGEADLRDSSFNVLVFDLKEGIYKSTQFVWNNEMYATSDEGSWEDYRDIPTKSRNPLDLVADFRKTLADPGASFRQFPGHDLTLREIFVYPDLRSESGVEESRRLLSSQVLTDPVRLEGGVVLEGEEKIGASSLLYQLYERYYERGYVPLLVTGNQLRKATEREIDATIRVALLQQYGPDAQTKFDQLERRQKLLLLDDFDDSPVASASHRMQLIGALKKRFEYIIVTVGDLFDVKEIIASTGDAAFQSFHHYRLLPFGYSLRARLTRNWFQLGANDGSLSDADLLAKCHKAEKVMDAAMIRNIIPPLPIYLLTLLQSIDAGLSGQFQESGVGAYYHFLMLEGFRAARISESMWNEIIEYCTELCWYFHTQRGTEVSRQSLQEFNEGFSRTRVTVNFDARLDELIRSRVLVDPVSFSLST